jgi:hypothetical protein
MRRRNSSTTTEARVSGWSGATLTLPLAAESVDAFVQRLARVLREQSTLVYVDTSFLMWMTRIGSPARNELTNWLSDVCGTRLRVPVWAVHEYYRHHSEGTIQRDLAVQLDALERAVSGTYEQIWPLLDEPLGGAPSALAQQTEVRDALRALPGVAGIARRWTSEYDRHAHEVIAFINANALSGSRVPAYFEALEAVTEARFTGRVPPGYKDRRKKERKITEADEADTFVGSNRWGDFVFWREILDDARRRRARQIVLLTRDGKNDWRMSGALPVEPPTTDGGPGVAPAHPFLSFEAALEAGVREVLLVDQNRLALLAKSIAEPKTKAFVFVANSPKLPPPKTVEEHREEEKRREVTARQSVRGAMAAADGLRYLDPSGLRASAAVLGRALSESRTGKPIPPEVLEFEEHLTSAGEDPTALLTESRVTKLGGAGLVFVTRRLSTHAAETGVSAAVVSDLAKSLRQFPTKVAGAIYFGMLADAYLEPTQNSARPAPRSVALQTLFALQAEPFALIPIRALLDRLNKTERVPLYLPDPLAPIIVVSFHAHGDREPPTLLRSVRVRGLDLITPAQGDPTLRLSARLGGEPATPGLLVRQAADLYGLPLAQLDPKVDVDLAYTFEATVGFKAPRDVWLDPSELRL